MLRLSSVLLLALSACMAGAPPPAGPASPPGIAGRPDMTGWRLMGDAIVTGQFEHQTFASESTQGAPRASRWW